MIGKELRPLPSCWSDFARKVGSLSHTAWFVQRHTNRAIPPHSESTAVMEQAVEELRSHGRLDAKPDLDHWLRRAFPVTESSSAAVPIAIIANAGDVL